MHRVYPIVGRTERGGPVPGHHSGPPQCVRVTATRSATSTAHAPAALSGVMLDVRPSRCGRSRCRDSGARGQAILVLHGDLDFGFMVIEGCSLRRRDTRRSTRRPADANGEDTIISDTTTASAESAVRPFRIEVPQGEIDELRRRINATRWPTRELVTDRSQGVQLAAIQNLARYFYIVAAYLAGAAR
jgi:hypothetical protein